MKKTITSIAITLIVILSSSNIVSAQEPGTTINKFFTSALDNCQDRWSGLVATNLSLQITVMTPGTNKNSGSDKTQWFAAYGEAMIPVVFSGNAFKFEKPKGFTPFGVTSANGKVKYWFSDRRDGIDKPFSSTKTENGDFAYFKNDAVYTPGIKSSPVSLNLFNQWHWNVTKAIIVGNMLYGEINNGANTFSISYGAVGEYGGR